MLSTDGGNTYKELGNGTDIENIFVTLDSPVSGKTAPPSPWHIVSSLKTAKTYNLVVGIYIKSVEDFSSAEKGGLKAGDVIIEADGKSIKTMDELNEIKNSHQIGDEIKLKINRDGSEKEITLTLGEQP